MLTFNPTPISYEKTNVACPACLPACLMLLFCNVAFSQTIPDSLFDGSLIISGTTHQPEEWQYQRDIFAFECAEGAAYTGEYDTLIIDTMIHRTERRVQMMEVFFNIDATTESKLDEIAAIRNHEDYQREFPTITKDWEEPYNNQKWYILDDLIFVEFFDPAIDSTDLADFMDRNNLSLYRAPDTPFVSGLSYVHQFLIDDIPESYFEDPASTYSTIIEEENTLVKDALPNVTNIRMANPAWGGISGGSGSAGTTPFNCGTQTVYDQFLGTPGQGMQQWHIDNDGTYTNTLTSLGTATSGADANICACWSAGLSGDGEIAIVIATSDYNLGHNEFSGVFLGSRANVDPITGQPIGVGRDFSPAGPIGTGYGAPITSQPTNGGAGGQFLSAYLAANWSLSSTSIADGGAGVAPEMQIIPYQITSGYNITYQFTSVEFNKIYDAFVSAVEIDKTDIDNEELIKIIVTDLAADGPSFAFQTDHILHDAIKGLHSQGRAIIAPAGVSLSSSSSGSGSTGNFYPAAWDEVIGVIASTPEDEKKEASDDWNYPPGSLYYATNYGTQYDVAAPGGAIWVPSGGTSSFSSGNLNPVNASVATVAGIVAMLWEDDPNLSLTQLRWKLRNGADQVGGYSYTNDISAEMGHGRVNCGAALTANPWTTGIAQMENRYEIHVENPVREELQLSHIAFGKQTRLQIHDLYGKVLTSHFIAPNEEITQLSVSHLSSGVYFLRLEQENKMIWSQKVIKQ